MKNSDFVKNTLDSIPKANADAKHITGLIKQKGRVTGYHLSDNTNIDKQTAVSMAKRGEIANVGIAHRGNNEYLKAIPNSKESDNLSNLPTISAK